MEQRYKIGISSGNGSGLEGLNDLSAEMARHFKIYTVDGSYKGFLNKIEPGLFITGGTARAVALEQVCGISDNQITPPTDIDWIIFGNRNIRVKNTLLDAEKRNIQFNKNTPRILADYCNKTDFDVDGLVVGRLSEQEDPHVFLTPIAERSYLNKNLDYAPNYKGVERNLFGKVKSINNRVVSLRALLFELRLERHGFKSKINHEVLKKALMEDWNYLVATHNVLDYVSRSQHDRLMDEYVDLLQSLGFTVPRSIQLQVQQFRRKDIESFIMSDRRAE